MKKTSFEIIPAVDILGGKCVRLTMGEYDKVEEFSSNPNEIAKKWVDLGASRLHIVDLDGAKEGHPINFKVICSLAKSTGIKVQVGGGIRTLKTIKEYLNEGISYIILGTKALKDKVFLDEMLEKYNEKIIVGLDIKNKRLALSGWQETADLDINKLARYLGKAKQIIYTDVSKDGTLSGPNLKSIEEVAATFKSEIIVSGGMSTINDILSIIKIKKHKYPNISGVILGKSLYKGTIELSSAIELAMTSF